MSTNNVTPYAGTVKIDLANLSGKLIDIADGDLVGYKREKPGIETVLQELPVALAAYGEAARLHPAILTSFQSNSDILAKIRAALPIIAKLHEVLVESEVYYEDAREADIARIASAIKDAARLEENPSLLIGFEKTIQYRAQYAERAAATRKKNGKQKVDETKVDET